jgi:hypothetical protein
LSPRHHDRLAGIALAEQGATKPGTSLTRELIEWLGDEALAGRLSDPQKLRFYEQTMRLTLAVRPRVIEGDPAPYRIAHEGRGPVGNVLRWWNRIESVSASVDDGPPQPLGGSSGSFSGLGSAGSTGATVGVKGLGRHELKVRVYVEVWSGPDFALATSSRNTLQHRRDVTVTGVLEVVPDAPADRIQHQAPDPATEARLRAAMTPKNFAIRSGPHPTLGGAFNLQAVPADIAFSVAARAGGKEHSLGTITLATGGSTEYYVGGNYDGPADSSTIDLILRPDEKAARRTVDLVRIWDGALEFKGVPVAAAKR